MERLLNELKVWGCDVEGAMERFLEDEELYYSCLEMLVEDEELKRLGEELEEGETEEAFDCAHTLKGVIGNMGLTPMFEIIVRIVEPLRTGRVENLEPVYEELVEAKDYLKGLLDRE